MAKTLYVGGIPYSSTEESLRDAFAKAGTVESVKIITDKFSGRSRGFGFVDMASDEDAQKAIEMWHEQEFEGRKLIVNEARPMKERPPRDDEGAPAPAAEEAPAEEPEEEASAEEDDSEEKAA
jgi:RNA recognition motif-containing protein